MGPTTDDLIIRPVRRDDLGDAAGVAAVLNGVIAEGRTALAGHFTPEAELAFLQGLGPRSELFVFSIGALALSLPRISITSR